MQVKAVPAAIQLDTDAKRFYNRPKSIRLRKEALPAMFLSLAIILPLLSIFLRPGPLRQPLRLASLSPLLVILVVHVGAFGITDVAPERRQVVIRSRTGRRRRVPFADVAAVVLAPVDKEHNHISLVLKSGERILLTERHYYSTSVVRALAACVGCRLETEGRLDPRLVLRVLRNMIGCKRRQLTYLLCINGVHYHSFTRPKVSGGTRQIDVPIPTLKSVQRRILHSILDRIDPGRAAHGFVKGRGIVSNARGHVGKETVIHLDIEDFFPSVNYGRVYGLFRSQGFFRQEAAVLARLTTWQRRLPQGAPTSPAIANLVCRRLDARLAGLGVTMQATYTRYADDMVFSGPNAIRKMIPKIRQIVKEEGFKLADHKLGIYRRHRRQKVTGLVVNTQVSLPREFRRQVRAIVHNCARNGIERENRDADPLFARRVRGRIELIRMVHPAEADRLLAEWAVASSRRI